MAGTWSLPEELMIEILVRLPQKSLALCRCTCRYWCRLLSLSRFASSIVNRATTPRLLLFSSKSNNIEASLYDVEKKFSGTKRYYSPSKPIPTSSFKNVSFVGSCNGLLCFSDYENYVCLWNPCTGKSLKISYAPSGISLTSGAIITMGFGYDPVSKEYKLIRIVHTDNDQKEVMVYRSRTRSWRRIEDAPLRLCYLGNRSKAAYVNAALHWVCDGKETSKFITSFNVSNETLKEIPLPDIGAHANFSQLRTLQGCLSVFPCFSHPNRMDIWLMKDYPNKESWIRLFSIQLWFVYMEPLFFKKNGEILLLREGDTVVSYNPNTPVPDVKYYNFSHVTPFDAFAYVETFAGDRKKRKRTCCNTQRRLKKRKMRKE